MWEHDLMSLKCSEAEFHHFTTDGKLAIEDQKILEEHIESVKCRWCESGVDVVEIKNLSSQ